MSDRLCSCRREGQAEKKCPDMKTTPKGPRTQIIGLCSCSHGKRYGNLDHIISWRDNNF